MASPQTYKRVSDIPSTSVRVPKGQTPRDLWILNTPDGKELIFYSADEALKYIDQHYPGKLLQEGRYLEFTQTPSKETPALLISPARLPHYASENFPIHIPSSGRTPFERYMNAQIRSNSEANRRYADKFYSISDLESLTRTGDAAINPSYWDSDIYKDLRSGNDLAAILTSAPFLAYTAAETAPIWAPWVGRGLKLLTKPKNILATEIVGTLGTTANQWIPWLLNKGIPWAIGGTATVMGEQYLADNPPSFSMPYTGTANPPDAPTDATVAPGTSTASPAPASPEPERNDRTSGKAKSRSFLRPFGGYKGGSTGGNIVRVLRDAGYTGVGTDAILNLWDFAEDPDSAQWRWGLSRILTTPERGVLSILRKGHNYGSTPTAAPQDTTTTKTTPATPSSQPGDTIPAVSESQATSGDDDYQEWLNSQK